MINSIMLEELNRKRIFLIFKIEFFRKIVDDFIRGKKINFGVKIMSIIMYGDLEFYYL